jgi:hypothetical protein
VLFASRACFLAYSSFKAYRGFVAYGGTVAIAVDFVAANRDLSYPRHFDFIYKS